jgi:hypothetical protein
MAHFAQLDSANNVIQIVAINNAEVDNLPFPNSEPLGISFCQSLYGDETIWKQTSYNGSFRRQYASVGGFYYPPVDVFAFPQPYPSWSFDPQTANWNPPTPMPSIPAGYMAVWSEFDLQWYIVIGEGGSL